MNSMELLALSTISVCFSIRSIHSLSLKSAFLFFVDEKYFARVAIIYKCNFQLDSFSFSIFNPGFIAVPDTVIFGHRCRDQIVEVILIDVDGVVLEHVILHRLNTHGMKLRQLFAEFLRLTESRPLMFVAQLSLFSTRRRNLWTTSGSHGFISFGQPPSVCNIPVFVASFLSVCTWGPDTS